MPLIRHYGSLPGELLAMCPQQSRLRSLFIVQLVNGHQFKSYQFPLTP